MGLIVLIKSKQNAILVGDVALKPLSPFCRMGTQGSTI